MAADVANQMNAKCLILNHFSQRYKPTDYEISKAPSSSQKENSLVSEGDIDDEVVDSIQKLVEEAKLLFKGQVIGAYDFYSHKV